MNTQKLPVFPKPAPAFPFLPVVLLALSVPIMAVAQVNSGSNGSDGVFNPTTNTNVDMTSHPNGVYQYTAVNIPGNVTVTFTPNASNTPVVWLVQSNCTIQGSVSVSGQTYSTGSGGPGGGRGGNGSNIPTPGEGPGGGLTSGAFGAGGSFGTLGDGPTNTVSPIYGNTFLVPLLGGSGGAGAYASTFIHGGGGGGGGAMLIAATGDIQLDGNISANGGDGVAGGAGILKSGGGSGGGIRLVCTRFQGTGTVAVVGGTGGGYAGGYGRVRVDTLQNLFAGTYPTNVTTIGFQPIIIPAPGQGAQLHIASVSGAPLPPDAIISSQQTNPVPVVVQCENIPLNAPITVTVRPASGLQVSAVGFNTNGTQASSTATVLINIPRGGGIIYATASIAP